MTIESAAARTPAAPSRSASKSLLPVFCMALGTFAIGTEGFMIAPLLPRMADDFGMPVATVALLITVFTLTLSLSSPLLTVATGSINRRNLLIAAMGAFAVANFVAWSSTSFAGIMIARILLAASAGLYIPNANALAGVIVAPEQRGRALSIVSGGMTIAIAFGLPLGAVIGHAFGWRETFFGVGLMALVAVIGIAFGISADSVRDIPVAGLRARLRVATQPNVLRALAVTFLWSLGAYAAYPFIAPYLIDVVGFREWGITAAVSLWGCSAAVGVVLGGAFNDRLGSARVIVPSLALLALSFFVLFAATLLPQGVTTLVLVLASISLWGVTVWSFFPAQMARLIAAGGTAAAPISLSLNTSVMYGGFAAGSALGSVLLAHVSVSGIYLTAGIAEILAILVFAITNRER